MTDLIDRLSAALAGRYAIERELGVGGMATVYLAEDVKHHRPVALKVLRPDLAEVLGGQRFLREIEIAAHLQHPHVLTLIDSGEAGGLFYYVMPFVRGESLRHRLARERQLPIRDAVRILRDVADGLADAHRQGLVHRDIKPDNVMLSGNHAFVTDFGVAKAVTSSGDVQQLTTAGIALGTPTYMSPEQATAETHIDHRTDIYALGVMGYEMLTGEPPFTGSRVGEILAAHLTTPPEPIAGRRDDIPTALADLVMRCLAKRPEDRWESMDDVLRRLEAIATPSAGVPSARVPAARRQWSRWRWVVVAGGVLAAAVVIGIARSTSASRQALLAELTPAVEVGRIDEVYAILRRSNAALGMRGLEDVRHAVGAVASFASEPPGAQVTLARIPVRPDSLADPEILSRTPIDRRWLVAGNYLATLEKAGFQSLTFAFELQPADTVDLRRSLVPEEWDVPGMLVVDSGTVMGPLAPALRQQSVPAFLIDRYELSNRAFAEFVAAGGYAAATLWPETLVVDGRRLARAEALRLFVDRTGLPGPRGWRDGTFPSGGGDLPVTGVSWYEAAAFAAWAGKRLPTAGQWWRAAIGDRNQPFPWGTDPMTFDDRSNFGMNGPTPVDRYPAGISPYGCYNMAGNVREWLADGDARGEYVAVGGSWQDPTYAFSTPNVAQFPAAFASDAIGIRLVRPIPPPADTRSRR